MSVGLLGIGEVLSGVSDFERLCRKRLSCALFEKIVGGIVGYWFGRGGLRF